MSQTIFNYLLYRRGYCTPSTTKQLGYLFPWQELRPCSQKMGKGCGEPMFASAPGEVFNLDAAITTMHSSRCISKPNRNSPKWYMPKSTNGKGIPVFGSASATTAKDHASLIRSEINSNFSCISVNFSYTNLTFRLRFYLKCFPQLFQLNNS